MTHLIANHNVVYVHVNKPQVTPSHASVYVVTNVPCTNVAFCKVLLCFAADELPEGFQQLAAFSTLAHSGGMSVPVELQYLVNIRNVNHAFQKYTNALSNATSGQDLWNMSKARLQSGQLPQGPRGFHRHYICLSSVVVP